MTTLFEQPDIRPIAEGRYRLNETFKVVWQGWRFVIPAGFEHDGASVPRLAWTLSGIRPDGLIRAAALIHDALYQHAGDMPRRWVRPEHRTFTRAEADWVFYEVMAAAGVGWWKRNVAYTAVRVGGWLAWRSSSRRKRSTQA